MANNGIKMLELPKLLNLEGIIKKAELGEELNQTELGCLLTGTFGNLTTLLTFCIGKIGEPEAEKEEYVANLNNNIRFADLIEDGKLSKPQKQSLLGELTSVYNKAEVREKEELVSELKDIAIKTRKGAINRKEELFLEQIEKYGSILTKLRSFRPSIRKPIVMCINKLTNGMSVSIRNGIKTMSDLEDYCYYVAGTVGEALNEIVNIEDRENLNRNKARSIAAYFQLNNILSNVREDSELREYRTKFIPIELHEGLSYEELIEKETKQAKNMRETVYNGFLSLANKHFIPSAQYVLEIPRRISGWKVFCGASLILYKERQKAMERAGSEKVFKGERSAIKVSEETARNVLTYSISSQKLDGGITYEKFFDEYRKDPDNFPFTSPEHEEWSPKWPTI